MKIVETEEDLMADDGNMRLRKDAWFQLMTNMSAIWEPIADWVYFHTRS